MKLKAAVERCRGCEWMGRGKHAGYCTFPPWRLITEIEECKNAPPKEEGK